MKHQGAAELAPFSRPCCYVNNSKVNQHIGVEDNMAAVELGDEKTALDLIV
jgi:hypothetical protein